MPKVALLTPDDPEQGPWNAPSPAEGAERLAALLARPTPQSLIASYVDAGGYKGGLIELRCETEFVRGTEEFQRLAQDLAQHVAVMAPQYLRPADAPSESQAADERVLLKQRFIKDSSRTVEQLLAEVMAQLGENIVIARFVGFAAGEAPSPPA